MNLVAFDPQQIFTQQRNHPLNISITRKMRPQLCLKQELLQFYNTA